MFRRPASCAALFLVAAVHADVRLVGVATLPGDTADKSGLAGKQKDGMPKNRLGGHGSAIAYTGVGNRYILVSDRGPADGASEFACRYHAFDIAVRADGKPAVSIDLVSTTMLTGEKGEPLTGSLAGGSRRFDPEGVRVGPAGTLFVSDEYGPDLAEFAADGRQLRRFVLPSRFRPTRPSAVPLDELPPKNTHGRQPNRGIEGLAITPDGGTLLAALQSPLIQDGGVDKENKRVGLNCRIVTVEVATGTSREFVYPLDEAANGISEIVAVSATTFLVLERDGLLGKEAKYKKIVLADLSQATDVSAVEHLPAARLPAGVEPMRKRVLIDLLDSRFGLAGEKCPEKFEGLAFGPDLPDGRRLLLVTVDNDFVPTVPFRVLAFAIDRDDLPGFTPQAFAK